MIIKEVYFSPTGNCKRICDYAAKSAKSGNDEIRSIDITFPQDRQKEIYVEKDELLVITMPIYASRLPNKIMPFVRDNIKSNGGKAIAIVSFGNRSFGDGLSELSMLLEDNGFEVIGAAAMASEHSFATEIGKGRPNEKDLAGLKTFVEDSIKSQGEVLTVEGNRPPGDYYKPLGEDNKPAVFLKAKPTTDKSKCLECGECAKNCSMGSINPIDYSIVEGICIKCQRCIKICKMGAKSFEDKAFLSHKRMLEANFRSPKENKFFTRK